MITQKLYKTGNSISMTIPREYLVDFNWQTGSQVIVDKVGNKLTVTPKLNLPLSDVDQKFAKMVDEFINDHEDVLRELSNR